jgi:hypothetical protein
VLNKGGNDPTSPWWLRGYHETSISLVVHGWTVISVYGDQNAFWSNLV